MSNNELAQSEAWKNLEEHSLEMRDTHMSSLFSAEPSRAHDFSVTCDTLYFNYARNNITEKTINHLIDLGQQQGLESWRKKLFSGDKINSSENRAALHTAMRDPDNHNEDVIETHEKLRSFSQDIIVDQNITDVVHIGIGGSDLGPRLVYDALKSQHKTYKTIHFVSNVDPIELSSVLKKIDAKKTLFIIASKTFTTLETLTNANSAKSWMIQHAGQEAVQKQFIAITGQEARAIDFGISEHHIFNLPDWVGGRYSQWSAIGLPLCLAFGYDVFQEFLNGAFTADQHFQSAPLDKNIPVLMALISLWYRNFWDYRAHAILPYDERLKHFPVYMQQLDMESNGKSVTRSGEYINHKTSPVIFGEPGTNGQHAFYQMLHQGSDIIPCDFIVCAQNTNKNTELLPGHHQKLIANALGQAQALMLGQKNKQEPHKNFEGNRPSNSIILQDMSAKTLGMLMAFYEHKIFVQGVIWGINSFDQWGVELGKTLASDVLDALEKRAHDGLDETTAEILSVIEDNQFGKS